MERCSLFSQAFIGWEICKLETTWKIISSFWNRESQEPDKPSHLSWDSSRAGLEPSFSSFKPIPTAELGWFPSSSWQSRLTTDMSFPKRNPAHCHWCPSVGECAPRVPTKLAVDSSQNQPQQSFLHLLASPSPEQGLHGLCFTVYSAVTPCVVPVCPLTSSNLIAPSSFDL
jgi:hypothetical protein